MPWQLIDEIRQLHYDTIQKQPPTVFVGKKLEIFKNIRKVLKMDAEPLKLAIEEFIFNEATTL